LNQAAGQAGRAAGAAQFAANATCRLPARPKRKFHEWFYNLLYSRFRAPWYLGQRRELMELVESGRIRPGRAIDLGCGAGTNAIYLAILDDLRPPQREPYLHNMLPLTLAGSQ
jgi:hypothetical protein